MTTYLLVPLVGVLGWICLLFVWLTVARTVAVGKGEVEYGAFVLGRDEPLPVARITRNLSNNFELPPLFVACAGLIVAMRQVTAFDVTMAWLFG